jgi:hypothetical protein
VREINLVRLVLGKSRAGTLPGIARPQRRIGLQVFQVLEDLRRIEDLQVAVHQHGHLRLWIDAQHFGMLGLVERLEIERHHHQFEVNALLQCGDLRLRAEHAQRPGVESDAICRIGHGAP